MARIFKSQENTLFSKINSRLLKVIEDPLCQTQCKLLYLFNPHSSPISYRLSFNHLTNQETKN